MAHGDLLRTYRATDKTGQLTGLAKVLEVTIADGDTTASLVAAEAGESARIVGGFVNVSAAAEIVVQDEDDNALSGAIVIGAANSQVLFDQEDFIKGPAGKALEITRSVSCAVKGEIHVVYS